MNIEDIKIQSLLKKIIYNDFLTEDDKILFQSHRDDIQIFKESQVFKNLQFQIIDKCIQNNDVLTWGRIFFPSKFPSRFCYELHQYFVDIMYSPYTVTMAPRGASKTTIMCFLIPTYIGLNNGEKYNHIVNIQCTSDRGESRNREIRVEFEENQLLREYYCEYKGMGELVSKYWTGAQFQLTNGVVYTGLSAEGNIKGTSYRNIRPKFLVIDDLYREEDISFPTARKRRTDWFDSAVIPAMSAKEDEPCIHIIGTAIAQDDLYHKKKDAASFKFRKFQTIKNYETKEVLWPERFPFEDIMNIKIGQNMSTITFNREYQNEITSDEESCIKEYWIKWYDEIDMSKENFISRVLCVDPSIGKGNDSDYTGLAVISKTHNIELDMDRYYVEYVDQKRLSMQQRIDTINDLAEQFKVDMILVEAVSGFNDFLEQLTKNTTFYVRKVNGKNKYQTLQMKSGFFENGKVFVKNTIDAKLKRELIDQLTLNFPPHDDMRDAVLMGLNEQFGKIGCIRII